MKNQEIKIVVLDQVFITNLENIKANYTLEAEIASEFGKTKEFRSHEHFKTIEAYTSALVAGKIENYDNELELDTTHDLGDYPDGFNPDLYGL
ncbi:hypothetical protein FVB32_05455 [Flagellimonas hymeniacidonis]|uniref:Uncharacterized protein n=1 Tax=Flagellimonas hymeniacidonis TaxID=2603628 RepID=A0A5C8V8N6_9FLAO|nr:hypothetical protein [Flagellimonas hymeniacidonis]TXN37736.1 hypothetical protein FVB32_05455 [Flagellimonas hymeniacidonis]